MRFSNIFYNVAIGLFLFTMQSPILEANSQVLTQRWDFENDAEGWNDYYNSPFEIVDGYYVYYPHTYNERILIQKQLDGKLLKSIALSCSLNGPIGMDLYIRAHVINDSDQTIGSVNTVSLVSERPQPVSTLVFNQAINNPQKVEISLKSFSTASNYKVSIDWIETRGIHIPSGDFELILDPPGDTVQKGTQEEFDVQANFPEQNNTFNSRFIPMIDFNSQFTLVEDSPFGEISNLEVTKTGVTGKFNFDAQELGKHFVNFQATLNVSPTPLVVNYQLPIAVIEENPDELFADLTTVGSWMLFD